MHENEHGIHAFDEVIPPRVVGYVGATHGPNKGGYGGDMDEYEVEIASDPACDGSIRFDLNQHVRNRVHHVSLNQKHIKVELGYAHNESQEYPAAAADEGAVIGGAEPVNVARGTGSPKIRANLMYGLPLKRRRVDVDLGNDSSYC